MIEIIFDYFCKYHDGRGLGKNDVYLIILVIERELLVDGFELT